MTLSNLPPESSDRDRPVPPSVRPVTDEEWWAIALALGVMGSLLFVLGRGSGVGLDWLNGSSPATPQTTAETTAETTTAETTTEPASTQPSPTASPSPVAAADGANRAGAPSPRPSSSSPLPDDPSRRPSALSALPLLAPITAPSLAAPASPSPSVPLASSGVVPEALPSPTAVNFSDVPANYWAAPFINGLAARGVVVGNSAGTFSPESPVTRGQLAAAIAKAFTRPGLQPTPPNFKDLSATHPARAAIGEAIALGFLKGYPKAMFRPDAPVARLELFLALATGLGLKSDRDPATVLGGLADAGAIAPWARPKIAAALAANTITADPATRRFDPARPATRAEVSVALYQSLANAGSLPAIASPRLAKP